MTVVRTFFCDGEDCERHIRAAPGADRPQIFLTVSEGEGPAEWHFCGWDCLLRHAAAQEPETIIRSGEAP